MCCEAPLRLCVIFFGRVFHKGRSVLLKKHLCRNSDLIVISEYPIFVLLCIFVLTVGWCSFLLKAVFISKGTKESHFAI